MAQLIDIQRVEVGPKHFTARVRIADDAPLMTSDDLEGTARVYYLLPHIVDHVCLGDESEHFKDVMGATELGHLLEHVTVELLAQTNIAGDVSCGRTFPVEDDPRAFDIELSCPDDVLVSAALASAVWMLQWAYADGSDPQPDVEATVNGLVQLVQSLPEPEPQRAEPGTQIVDEFTPEEPAPADAFGTLGEEPGPVEEPEPIAEPAEEPELIEGAAEEPVLAEEPEPAEEPAEVLEPEPEPEPEPGPEPEPEPELEPVELPWDEPEPELLDELEEDEEEAYDDLGSTAVIDARRIRSVTAEQVETGAPAASADPEPEAEEPTEPVEPSEPAEHIPEPHAIR